MEGLNSAGIVSEGDGARPITESIDRLPADKAFAVNRSGAPHSSCDGVACCVRCGCSYLTPDVRTALTRQIQREESDLVLGAERLNDTTRALIDGSDMAHADRSHAAIYETALHEAAHAVTAVHLGARISVVSVEKMVCWHSPPRPRSLEAELAITIAGPAVSAQHVGWKFSITDAHALERLTDARTGWKGPCDGCSVFSTLLQHMPDATDAEILTAYRRAEQSTDAFIREPTVRWSIGRVADALIQRGDLQHADVIALMHPSVLPDRSGS